MSLITVTQAKVKKDWLGREKIDHEDKGKPFMIPTDHVIKIEGWSGGSKVYMNDGTVHVVVESMDEIASQVRVHVD